MCVYIYIYTHTHIYTAESHHCSPETVTILLIGYTPIQNFLVLKNKKELERLYGKPNSLSIEDRIKCMLEK